MLEAGDHRDVVDLSEVPGEAKGEAEMRAAGAKLALSAAENKLVRERAEAAGQTVAEYIRALVLAFEETAEPDEAELHRQLVQLRARCDTFATKNADLERQLSLRVAEVEGLRAVDGGEAGELRQRAAGLAEHLDAADRHAASLRNRLEQQSAEATRRIAALETRLRERELELVREIERISASSVADNAGLRKKVEELTQSNHRLAHESQSSAVAAARQYQSVEARVRTLLSDIDEMKKRSSEALSDRDTMIAQLRQELEKTRSAAGTEQTMLRRTLTDLEAARQRDAAQHARTVEVLKSKLAAIGREAQSVHEADMAERARLETVIADARDRMRHQIEAHEDERRKIEARANAAEKQASGATAKATMEIARANELQMRLDEERTSRADEIDALQQRVEALSAQLTAGQRSHQLVLDDLRVRLAEFEGDAAASATISAARDRLTLLLSEIDALRIRVAEAEAKSQVPSYMAAEPEIDHPVEDDETLTLAEEVPASHPAPAAAAPSHGQDSNRAPMMAPAPSLRPFVTGLGAKAVSFATAASRRARGNT